MAAGAVAIPPDRRIASSSSTILASCGSSRAAACESSARAIVGGYGRVGHTVGTILASSGIPYIMAGMKTLLETGEPLGAG